jgi:hypothetical protein
LPGAIPALLATVQKELPAPCPQRIGAELYNRLNAQV